MATMYSATRPLMLTMKRYRPCVKARPRKMPTFPGCFHPPPMILYLRRRALLPGCPCSRERRLRGAGKPSVWSNTLAEDFARKGSKSNPHSSFWHSACSCWGACAAWASEACATVMERAAHGATAWAWEAHLQVRVKAARSHSLCSVVLAMPQPHKLPNNSQRVVSRWIREDAVELPKPRQSRHAQPSPSQLCGLPMPQPPKLTNSCQKLLCGFDLLPFLAKASVRAFDQTLGFPVPRKRWSFEHGGPVRRALRCQSKA